MAHLEKPGKVKMYRVPSKDRRMRAANNRSIKYEQFDKDVVNDKLTLESRFLHFFVSVTSPSAPCYVFVTDNHVLLGFKQLTVLHRRHWVMAREGGGGVVGAAVQEVSSWAAEFTHRPLLTVLLGSMFHFLPLQLTAGEGL